MGACRCSIAANVAASDMIAAGCMIAVSLGEAVHRRIVVRYMAAGCCRVVGHCKIVHHCKIARHHMTAGYHSLVGRYKIAGLYEGFARSAMSANTCCWAVTGPENAGSHRRLR